MAHESSRTRAVCQALERRRLLSVTVTFNGAGTLNLTFHAANDTATVTSNSTTGNRFTVSGTGLAATPFSNVTGLEFTGSSSFSSSATINNQTGDPITLSQSIAINNVQTSINVTQPISVHTFVSSGSPITLNVPTIAASADLSFFSAAVTLASDVTLASAGNITFGSTLNGAHSLTINNTGTTSFGGAVGGVTRLNNLTITGPGTTSIGAAISTSGQQHYEFPVTLTANSTIGSSAPGQGILFDSPVDGAFSLITNGGVQFGGPLGSITPLTSLTVNASPGGSLQRSGVTTTGNQSYSGEFDLGVTIRPNAFVSTASGNITFAGPMNGNGMPLAVNTGGITTFGGSINNAATLVTDAPGTTRAGGSIVVSGAITLNDPLVVTATTHLDSLSGGNVTLGGTVQGFVLEIGTSGNVNITQPVGLGSPLAALVVDGPGVIHLNGGSVTTNDQQEYDGPVVLGANWQGGAGLGGITFNGTIDGAFQMTLTTPETVTFDQVVGGNSPLNSLTINSPLDGAGDVLINTARVITHSFQDYGNPLTLAADCTLMAANGDMFFRHTVDGGFALTLTTAGSARFLDTVGGVTPLHSLVAHADNGLQLAAGVTTTSFQLYQSALQLDSNATLTSQSAGDISFASTVDGTTQLLPNLTLDTAGVTAFNGAVGAAHILGALTTDAPGTTLLNGGTVSVLNAQTYADPVFLGVGTTLNPGNALSIEQGSVIFDNTVNGAQQLSIRTGSFVVNAPIGGVTPLTSLNLLGAIASLRGAITTAAAQFFDELHQITLTDDLALNSVGAGPNNITFTGPVDGAHALTITTGTGDIGFDSDVGGTLPLSALNIVSANSVTGTTVTAGSITQSAGLGTTTFNTLHATAPAGINLVGKAFTLGTLNIDHGSLTIANAANSSVRGVITAAGGFTKAGPGTLTLAQVNQYPGLTNVTGGTLEFDKTILLPGGSPILAGGLHVGAGATAALGNPLVEGIVLTTSSLTFDGTPAEPQGRLDLFNGELFITFGNTPDPIAAVASEVAAGFNHGPWNGQGITSSSAATHPSQLAVGYADGIDGAAPLLPPGQILLRTTVPGDVNLDGTVNFNDLLTLAQHFGQQGTWDKGDLNYDGTVAFPDLLMLAQHFGNTLTTTAASSAARNRLALLR